MSQLIVDHVMLMYLHDLLSLRDKDAHFMIVMCIAY